MQAVSKKLGEDTEKWGLSGLLHDLDFDYVNKDPQWHVIKFDEILEKEGLKIGIDIDEDVDHAIRAHYEENPNIKEKRENNLDYHSSI
jgi:predicted hydrolase (HD superfamily)